MSDVHVKPATAAIRCAKSVVPTDPLLQPTGSHRLDTIVLISEGRSDDLSESSTQD